MVGIYLVPTPHTLRLAATPPRWGKSWDPKRWPHFQQTHCCDASSANSSGLVQHVLINSLARHAVAAASAASVCVVAAPPRGGCEPWETLCPPGLPLFVADIADADDFHSMLCPTLWKGNDCSANDSIVRLVSGPPVLVRRLMPRCRMLTVPWPSHARSAEVSERSRERRVRVAFAAGVYGHLLARRNGFERWRRSLRDACKALKEKEQCTAIYQSMAGGMASQAVELYARATFCLQPPGDTIVRTGIVDALSVGCIPVLFHPAQAALWTHFWDSSKASVLFDWTIRNRTWTSADDKAAAEEVLRVLMEMPQARVKALQRGVVEAARTTHYRGVIGKAEERDAVDVLEEHLLAVQPGRAV